MSAILLKKVIRLGGLKLKSEMNKAGAPMEFSFVITNAGNKDVVIPGSDFANVIAADHPISIGSNGSNRPIVRTAFKPKLTM